MSNLAHRQQKIKEKRKQTPRRDFVMEICSWYPLHMYRNEGVISIYPPTLRKNNIIFSGIFEAHRQEILEPGGAITGDMRQNIQQLFVDSILPGFHHYYNAENADYANHISNTKNAYLSFHVTGGCENVAYSLASKIHIKNIFNSVMSWIESENIYQSLGSIHSYNVFYSKCIKDSNNIRRCSDMIGCSECILCHGLEYQSYCIHNIAYSKEEYEKKKQGFLDQKDQFPIWYENLSAIGNNIASHKVTGYYCSNSDTVESGRFSHFVSEGRNILFAGHPDGLQKAYDALFVSAGEEYYGACGVGGDSQRIYNCISVMGGFDCYYSYFLENCSFCCGCIGLKNKSYCILNKQYSKEERYEKVDEIFGQMERKGSLGNFFPPSMCPFYFNDTVAYLIDPSFSKEEVTTKGYLWRDEVIRVDIPEGAVVVSIDDLGKYEGWRNNETGEILPQMTDHKLQNLGSMQSEVWSRWVDPSILSVIIQDESGNVYRIVKMEYDFLIKHGLPLPRKHWLERMKGNFKIG